MKVVCKSCEKEVEIKVACLSCYKQVEVKMVCYSGKHVAVCPLCNKLAYNGK